MRPLEGVVVRDGEGDAQDVDDVPRGRVVVPVVGFFIVSQGLDPRAPFHDAVRHGPKGAQNLVHGRVEGVAREQVGGV